MVDTIINPIRGYYPWKLPIFRKSADDWDNWNTTEDYYRSIFIGIDDTVDPLTVSLYLNYNGKPVRSVGSDVIASFEKLDEQVKQTLAEVQQILVEVEAITKNISELDAKVTAAVLKIGQDLAAWEDDKNAALEEIAKQVALSTANAAESATQAAAAKESETNAKASETAASDSATASAQSANASAQSASEAKTSETNSKASETAAAQSATEASTSASEASASAQAAATSATDANDAAQRAANSNVAALNSSYLAQSWAIGGISTRPEGSAKYWAETAEQKAGLNTIRTNCITSAPQNIKLELKNGTFTLKTGGKVYDGNGLFKSIDSDLTLTPSGYVDISHVLFVKEDGTLYARSVVDCASGDTTPSTDTWLYYNTTDKKVYQIENGVNVGTASFPLCTFNVSGGSAISIDQVFNDFGYIGNTMFSLQSIKGLIPNGRNADGSLNNIEFETTSVLTHTNTIGNFNAYIVLNSSFLGMAGIDGVTYEEDNNLNYASYASAYADWAIVGTVSTDSTGRITSFNPKLPFQALDRNDGALKDLSNISQSGKQTAVGWGIPDYSAGIAKELNKPITATRNCFVVVFTANSTNTAGLYVDNREVGVVGDTYAIAYHCLTAYVAKGQTYRTENIASYGSYTASVTEYPLIGG